MKRNFISSLIVFQVLLSFVHFAVYETLVAAFAGGGAVPAWGLYIFMALSLTFGAASLIVRKYANRAARFFYIGASYWFGLVHFMLIGAIAFLISIRVFYSTEIYIPPALIGIICFGVFFMIHLYGTWNSGRLRITFIKPEIRGLPAGMKGKRIVYVSDIHLGAVRGVRFAERVVGKIQELQPEAVFIGGDLYDGPACDVRGIIAPFRELKPPLGTYFITGNHEYYLPDVRAAIEAVREAGIRILDDEKADVGGVSVIGVDYSKSHDEEDFKKALDKIGVERDKVSLLLKHEPTDLKIASDAGVTFGIFGHTHRGQIFPLSLITKSSYRGYDYGSKSCGEMKTFTSSGAGTWGPPLRLGTKSEIVCVEL